MKHRIQLLIIAVLALALMGCVTVKPVQDPAVQALLYEEAGFNLAFFCLKGERETMLERTEKVIETAKGMLETTDVCQMVDLVVAYIEESPQFTSMNYAIKDAYRAVINSSVRLLKGLVAIEIETTEDQDRAKKGLVYFLDGALEGVGELRRIMKAPTGPSPSTVNRCPKKKTANG